MLYQKKKECEVKKIIKDSQTIRVASVVVGSNSGKTFFFVWRAEMAA